MKNRVIVCGGRDFKDKNLCFESLNSIIGNMSDVEIVSGHASGADTFGEEFSSEKGLEVSIFKPDWKQYGRAAGPIRNRQMLDYASEENAIIIAFWDGKSKGTKNMIDQAKKKGATVHVISYGA